MVLLIDLPLFALSSLSVAAFYLVAHREAGQKLAGALRWVPFLMAVGIGLSINNTRAVIEALLGKPSEFKRTPKYNLAKGQNLTTRRYRGKVNIDTWIELALTVHFAVATLAALASGLWGAVPFLLLFEVGYGYTALTTWMQALQVTAAGSARSELAGTS